MPSWDADQSPADSLPSPFNITIIQAYAATTDYDNDDIEDFYDQLYEVIDQAPKKDILAEQGDECIDRRGCKQELEGDMLPISQP